MTSDEKAWWQSKTVWGGIAAFAGSIVPLVVPAVSPDDVQQAVGLISTIVAAIGGLIAVVGRIVATKPIR